MSLSDSDSPLSSVPDSGDEHETLTSSHVVVVKSAVATTKSKQRKSSTPPRKPRKKEPPHVATLSDASELAFIVMFRSRFADAFKGVPNLGCQDIERGVVDSTPSEQIEVLLCRLVSLVLNRKKPVERGHHQRPLEEAVHAHVTQWPRSWDGKNPFSGGRHFSALDPPERLSVLKALINWSLTSSEAVRAIITESYKGSRHEDDLNIPISVQPWGRDGDKRRYWLIEGRDDTPFRLYRESNPALKTVSWISIAGTIDEIRAVATELQDEDGSKHALALKEKITAAIPRFEDGETRRKKREYRQSRKAFFKQPNGTSLYEGRTRGKRIKYTFSSEDEDIVKNASEDEGRSEGRSKRSARSLRSTPQPDAPRFTASGRQIRKPVTGVYGELKINGSNGTGTGEATPYAGSENGNAVGGGLPTEDSLTYGVDGAEDWKLGSYSGDNGEDDDGDDDDDDDDDDDGGGGGDDDDNGDDDEECGWVSPPEGEEEGAPKKSLRIILRVNKSRLPESPAKGNGVHGQGQSPHTNGIAHTGSGEKTTNGNAIHKAEQRTEIDILPDAPAVVRPIINSMG